MIFKTTLYKIVNGMLVKYGRLDIYLVPTETSEKKGIRKIKHHKDRNHGRQHNTLIYLEDEKQRMSSK